jgi:hypothetical protein
VIDLAFTIRRELFSDVATQVYHNSGAFQISLISQSLLYYGAVVIEDIYSNALSLQVKA